jgi:hypothetical protein
MKVGTRNPSKKNKRSSSPSHRWLTVSAIGLTVAGVTGIPCPGRCMLPFIRGTGPSRLLTQNATPLEFDIQPGMLSESLAEFERISGIKTTLSNEGIGMVAFVRSQRHVLPPIVPCS